MRIRRSIQILISIILLTVLVHWIDFGAFINAVRHANCLYIFLAVVLVGINRCVMAYKWNMLLRIQGIDISFIEATRIYYISSFLGMYLPPTIGADSVRAYYIRKKNFRFSDILAAIAAERIVGFVILLLFATFGGTTFYLVFFEAGVALRNVLTALICISGGSVLIVFMSLNKVISGKVLMLLKRPSRFGIVGRLGDGISQIYSSFLLYKQARVTLFLFSVMTVVEVLLYVLRTHMVVQALRIEVSFSVLLLFVPIIMTLIRLPISFNGFGINEGGFVYFFFALGIPKSSGFSVGLIDHLIVMMALLPGGILYLLDRGIRGEIKEEAANRGLVEGTTR